MSASVGRSSSALLPLVALAVTAVLWSSGGLLIKLVQLPALEVAGWRSLIAAAFLWCLTGLPRIRLSRQRLRAALAYAATVLLFVTATKLTTAANAILLQFTAPIYVALLAPRFTGDPVDRADWIAVGLSLCGMALFFCDRLSFEGMWGNLAGLASGAAFGFLVLELRRLKDDSPVSGVILGNALAALLAAPFLVLSRPTAADWTGLLLLGVLQLGISYFLYSWAIRRVSAMVGVLLPILEPVLNPIWVLLFLGERPGDFAVLGGAVILAAVTWRGLAAARPRRAPKAVPA